MIGLLYMFAFSMGNIAQISQDGANQMVGSAINRSVDDGDTRCCKEALRITEFCWMCRPYPGSPRTCGVPPACSALPDLAIPTRAARLAVLLLSGSFLRPVCGSDPHPPSPGLAYGMVEGRAVGEDPGEQAEAPSPPDPGPPHSRNSGTSRISFFMALFHGARGVLSFPHRELQIL